MTPGKTITCWPSVMCIAVCQAHQLPPPDVLILQSDFRGRRLEHHRLPFHHALRFAALRA